MNTKSMSSLARMLEGDGEPKQSKKFLSKIAFVLHALKVYLAVQLTPWRQRQELPKVAVYRSHIIGSLQCIVLVLPLTVATIMIVLNARTTLYTLPASSTVALQFAAKLSEIMMQMSLGTVLLGITRRVYLSAQSLPLGGLFASTQVTEISYLWSLEFWGAITSASLQRRQKIIAFACVFTMIALTALVGPSGAVLMIPRSITISNSQILLLLDNATASFPTNVSTELLLWSNMSKLETSLGSAFNKTQQLRELQGHVPITGGIVSGAKNSDDLHTPLFYTRQDRAFGVSGSWSTLASMPSLMVVEGLSSMFSGYSQTYSCQATQPLVRISCYNNSYWPDEKSATDYITFGSQNPKLNKLVTIADVMKHAQDIPSQPDVWASSSFFSIPLPNDVRDHSLALVIGGNKIAPDPGTNRYSMASAITACTVDAAWVTSHLRASRISMDVDTTNIDTMFDEVSLANIITLQPDVLTDLHDTINKTKFDSGIFIHEDTSLRILYALTLSLANYHGPERLQVVSSRNEYQSANISEFLYSAGLQYFGQFVTVSDNAWTNPAALTRIVIEPTNDALGYNSEGVTVRLSLAVMVLYCVVVVSYLINIFFTGIAGSSWDSVGELFMLALNSDRPAHVKNTSVGVRTLGTYREAVSLRVRDSDDSVEVVFVDGKRNDDDMCGLHRRVIHNIEY